MPDKNLKLIADHVLFNLFQMIENPTRLSFVKDGGENKYYAEVLEWCDTEVFWFDMWDEMLRIHPEVLKEKIRGKIKIKLSTVEEVDK